MAKRKSKKSRSPRKRSNPKRRKAKQESISYGVLEERKLLASVTVNSPLDDVLFGDDGDDSKITLREAIDKVNTTANTGNPIDTINFSFADQLIRLSRGSELELRGDLTINGNNNTIRATNQGNIGTRVLNISPEEFSGEEGKFPGNMSVELNDLTISSGRTFFSNDADNFGLARGAFVHSKFSGGGIRFNSRGTLTLSNSDVLNSETKGDLAPGGGIFALGEVVLKNGSQVMGNRTGFDTSEVFFNSGFRSLGGGIYSQAGVTLATGSVVAGNATRGYMSSGGGIASHGDIDISGNSRVENNKTLGELAYGGGAYSGGTFRNPSFNVATDPLEQLFLPATGSIVIDNSDVTGNSTHSNFSKGGGLFGVNVMLTNGSEVRENTTSDKSAHGGGIYAGDHLGIYDSTLAENGTSGGTSGSEAIACQVGVRLGKFLITKIPVIGTVYGVFKKVNGAIGIVDTDPCEEKGGGAFGGGGFGANITVESSVIDGNFTTGNYSDGGALFSKVSTTVDNSLVLNNFTENETSNGGAINSPGLDFDGQIRRGKVTITNSEFTNNGTKDAKSNGGAIYGGNVEVNDSIFNANYANRANSSGGAIFSRDGITVNRSLFSNNKTVGAFKVGSGSGDSPGGAISSQFAFINDSTFDSNHTESGSSDGGAIFATVSTTVRRSTFAGNYSDDSKGGAISAGSALVYESTFTRNTADDAGGSIYASGIIRMSNSIAVDSTVSGDPNDLEATSIDFLGNNAVGVATGSQSGPRFTASGSQVFNTTGGVTGPLEANNGRGAGRLGNLSVLPTIVLKSGINPAIDATTLSGEASDQRGFLRQFNDLSNSNSGLSDLGAIELQDINQLHVTTELLSQPGRVSLGEAIQFANTNLGPDRITFASFLAGQTIQLAGSDLDISEQIDIDASSLTSPLTIRGGDLVLDQNNNVVSDDRSRIFDSQGHNDPVTLRNLVLTNGHSDSEGGAIRSGSTAGVTLIGSVVSISVSLLKGGGIYSDGPVALISSAIYGNQTTGSSSDGGGIYADGDVTLVRSHVDNNLTPGRGGGVYSTGTVRLLIDSSVSGNETTGSNAEGGGIFANIAEISDGIVSNNSTDGANSSGGGIRANTVVANNSIISGNSTSGNFAYGGGVSGTLVTVTNSTVDGNSTSGESSLGGGIEAGNLRLENSVLSENRTTAINALGGGAYVYANATISNSTVANNRTGGINANGGGIHAGSLDLTNATVTGNSTGHPSANFGAINVTGIANVTNSLVVGNYSRHGYGTQQHELTATTLNTFGNNLFGGMNYVGTYADTIFEQTEPIKFLNGSSLSNNTSFRRGGTLASNGGNFESVELKANVSNPAIDGTVAPESLFSFADNANDGFGNNNGTLQGGLTADANGINGTAINIQGNGNQFVQLSNPLTIGDKSSTVEVWVKIPEINNDGLAAGERVGVILGSFSNTNALNANWEIHDDGEMRVFWKNGNRDIRGDFDLRDNKWHYLAFVRDLDSNEFRFYVDGEQDLVTSNAGDSFTFDVPHRIGKDLRGSTDVEFHGTMDELAIHERALTPEEIKIRAGILDGRGTGFDRIAAPVNHATGSPPQMDLGAFESETLEQQSLIVTTTEDVVDLRDGLTSIREAIAFANAGDADGDGFDADTISFDPSLTNESFVLVDGELVVSEPLEILGGQNTIDANGLSRVLRFSGTGDLTLNDLAIVNGRINGGDGGGIRFGSNGVLTLNRSRVALNTVDGTGSEGGGIFAVGDVVINNSTVDNNQTFGDGSGGGIFVEGDAFINNSTIIDNRSGGNGGGVYATGGGLSGSNILEVRNSTISGNEAEGSGGGIHTRTATIANSIVLGNQGSTALADPFDEIESANTIVFAGSNIVGESPDNFDAIAFANAQNAPLSTVFVTDSSGLSNFAPVLELRPTALNPALDAGDNSQAPAGTTDGSGAVRFVDLPGISNAANQTVDLGATELQANIEEERSLVVTTSTDVVDPFDLQTSLREAIAVADDTSGFFNPATGEFFGGIITQDTVTFADGPGQHFATPQTITLVGQDDIDVVFGITIEGPGVGQLTIDANFDSGIFDFGSSQFFGPTSELAPGGQRFVVKDLTLANGVTNGAIRVGNNSNTNARQSLTLENVVLKDNSSETSGGAISARRSDVTIMNSALVNNFADTEGSALYLSDSNALIANSTISGNSSGYSYGAIYQNAAADSLSLGLQNVTLADNTGDAIQTNAAGSAIEVTIGNTILADNSGSNFSGDAATTFTSMEGNVSDQSIAGLTGNDQVVADALLNPIDMSQPTLAHTLQPGSPAIDSGVNSNARVMVRPVSVTSDTVSDFRPIQNVISNDGVNVDNYETVQESNAGSWVTATAGTSDFFEDQQVQPVLVFDLGGIKTLSDVVIWGFSETASNDVSEFVLEFSVDGGNSYTEFVSLNKPVYTSTNFVNTLPLGAVFQADFVRMTITDNHGGDRVGFQEIRFLEEALNSDQTGADRIVDGNSDSVGTIDSGAVEENRVAFLVDTFGDVDDGLVTPGNLSIREAVRLANTAPGHDIIAFDESVFTTGNNTILTTSELVLTDSVTIAGPGAGGLAISGNNANRIFRVSGSSPSTFEFRDLSLINGDAGTLDGGAINATGSTSSLIVDGVEFLDNSANGGGAIFSAMDFTISNSSFVNNHANFNGSAFFGFGSLQGYIFNTTVAGSTHDGASSGAVFMQTSGTQQSHLQLRNVTIADNATAGLGGFSPAGGVATIDVGNSIVSDNTKGNALPTGDAVIQSSGFNISDDASPQFSAASDLPNTDPLLGILDYHDGSPTLIFDLAFNSLAIDGGSNVLAVDNGGNALLTDQRGEGFDRLIDGNNDGTVTVDIGAFEAELSQAVVGRGIFYNDSHYDGNNGAANSNDDGAIDTSKVALLPGQTATAANYTSYLNGINGVVIDVANLPASVTPTDGDFQFRIGNEDNTANWTTVGTQPNVSIRRGEGVGGSDRITVTWQPDANGDPVISDTWLQVTVLSDGANNLGVADEFYFGNLIGEVSGPSGDEAIINSLDFGSVSSNFTGIFTSLDVDAPYDINKDNKVNSFDAGIIGSRFTSIFGTTRRLRMITPFFGSNKSRIISGSLPTDTQGSDPQDGLATSTNLNSSGRSGKALDSASFKLPSFVLETPSPSTNLRTSTEQHRVHDLAGKTQQDFGSQDETIEPKVCFISDRLESSRLNSAFATSANSKIQPSEHMPDFALLDQSFEFDFSIESELDELLR